MKKNGFAKYQSAPGFAPLIIILVIAILAVVGYLGYKSISSMSLVATPSPTFDVAPQSDNKDNPGTDQGGCKITWVDPVLPTAGKIEPLFLKEAGRISGIGYEAIVGRKVVGDSVSVDIVTNLLPVKNSPYYLYAVAVDTAKNICSQSNLGILKEIPNANVWGAGPFTISTRNVNDAQLFIITEKGFGESSSDKIKSLTDPSIILIGSYEDNHL